MPRYAMVCPICGHEQDNLCTIADRDEPVKCCNCLGIVMERDFTAGRGAHVPETFHKPIEMYSIAPETEAQYDDLRRKCPDVEFNDLLVPLARDRQEKMRILKAVGGMELT